MKFTSIRLKVILLVLAMAVPIVLLGIAGTLYYQSILKQNIQDDELTMAKTISVMTPEYMNSSQLYLKSIADRPLVIKAMEDNDTAFLHSMAVYANETDRINSAYFTDNKGNVIASTQNISSTIGINVMNNLYVGDVLSTGDYVIGDAVPGYDKMPVVPIGVPIKDDNGTILGVLVGTVDLNVYSKMVRQGAVNDQQIVYLVNRTGHIMIHNDPQYVKTMENFSSVPSVQYLLQGKTGITEYYNTVENSSRLSAYVPIEPIGWGVVVALPTSIAYQPVWNAAYLFAAGTALLTLGAILLGLFIANGLTTPILRLSLATKKISDCSYTELLPLDRKDEIGDLAHSFKGMVDDLQTKQEELETQTEELEVQNEEIRENNVELQKQILDRKRAEEALSESEERFRALADNIPNLAWMADAKGWIFWYNKQWYDYTGTTLEEMQGWGWQKVHHPDYVDAVTKEWSDSIAAGKPYDNIFPLKGKDGNYGWFLTRISPIRDEKGNIVRWFGTNTDITDRKQMEEDLKVANAQAELYLDLMGHDISNMHQIIMGQLELAQEILETDCKLDAVDKTLIDTSLETLDRSARLIDNVRNLQKLSHGEFREEVIDLDGLLSNVIKEFDVIVPDGSIKLVSNGLHYVKANKLMHDVFTNLVGNAIKHSNKNNIDIAIKLDSVKENGKNYYRVSVEDNGPGISDDMKVKVFNRLQRGKTEARGVGLGLYLVKTLVESFGGFVKVEDRVQGDHTKGAKFLVYLPIMGGEILDE